MCSPSAIKSLSHTVEADNRNRGYEESCYTGLDQVVMRLRSTTDQLQHRFDTKVARDMADINDAADLIRSNSRAQDRIKELEASEQAKQPQIDKLSQQIIVIEGKIAAQSSSLAEKDNELAVKEQEIQNLTAQCKFPQQQKLKPVS
ncbi:hypothetical protein D0865_15079 [Hortaea werneckii]|uniref:Uncharacterized protein n=1 Tax=Hortaea werneckii TaxID=91943 RepID=A0A3M7AUE9_HORWE|nr:hypothetical protein D0865_15079 [Hortaea werneckii]